MDRVISGGLSAGEIEAISMIRRGFEELVEGDSAGDGNGRLAWKILSGVLGGINECVLFDSLRL